MSTPSWLTAFIDLPAAEHERGGEFWSGVTGWPLSPPRGDTDEFTTLLPADGDPHLKVQRVGDGRARTHLDVHVADPEATLERVEELGGGLVERHPGSYVVARSPGGYPFCLVGERLARRAAPVTWPGGHASIVDQLCLDIPAGHFAAETRFWADLTGWDLRSSTVREEFAYLVRPREIALRLLLQRLDDTDGVVRGHLDVATTDRQAEVRRHEALGATRSATQSGGHWTVMRDPAGAAYCITDRQPRSSAQHARTSSTPT